MIVSGVGWGSTERYPLPSGKPGRYERLHVNGSIPFHFTLGQNAVLAHVTRNYVPMSRDELLQDVVYQTDSVKAARFGECLPMEMVDNRGREAVLFDLEEVLDAEKRARSGQLLTLTELMSAVQASISS